MSIAFNKPIPGIVEDAPEVFPGLELFLEAYEQLTTERPAGFGFVPPIPRSAIKDWFRCVGGDLELTERGVYLVTQLDAEFREWSAEQQPSTPDTTNRKPIGGADGGPD